MNRNLMIVLAGGFLIAVLVAMMVQATLKSGNKKKVAPDTSVEIIVAATPIATGAKLSEKNMKWQAWPEGAVFEGAIVREKGKKITDMISGRAKRPLAAGEPIVKSALVSDKEGNFVAASLGDGMRAIAIETSAVRMAGGFIGPEDYVDVILTYKQSFKYSGPPNPEILDMIKLNLNKLATETIMQNVRVLGVDTAAKRSAEKPNKAGKTITLEVDPRGAEVLAMAGKVGTLTLSLRKLGDSKIYPKPYSVITDERLTTIVDEIYGKVLDIQKTSGQDQNIVRIYNGSSVAQVPVAP